MKEISFAETVRLKMKTGDTPGRQRYTIRDLANLTGYCYEHIRKVVRGMPVVSEELSDQLSELLGLDKDAMWRQAQREKLAQRFPGVPAVDLLPSDSRIADVWPKLNREQQDRLVTIASGWAEENRVLSDNLRSRDARLN